MKTLTLAFVLLSTLAFGQIKYSATTELRNYKTNSTPGASPVGADFGGYTIWCYNLGNNLVYGRTGTIINAAYFMFKASDGIGNTDPVVVTSFERYGYPKFQWSVRYSDIAGNIPPRTDFTSPSIRCINRADGKVYAMANGIVKVEYLIVPYSQTCVYTYSNWSACGVNGIKTRTVVSQSPEGCEGTPILTATCTYVPPAVECNYIYSSWSPCGVDGTRTRTVVSKYPYGCTGDPVLIDSCTYVPPTCVYVYSAWGTCQENNTQTRTVISSLPGGCEGTPVLTQACTYVPPVCTYTYSAWSECIDGMKTRTVVDSVPSNCAGTPVLNELCEPEPCVYTYSAWSACDITGHRTRTVVSATPNGCTGAPVLSETCTYVPPTCTYTYTEWSACSPSGFRTRSVLSSSPSGCAGTPVTVENCVYVPPAIPQGDHNYYVSSSTGNDAYTSTQAHSSATPWKTTGRVSSFSKNLLPGDSVLFKRGDTFISNGVIYPELGGAGNPVVFAAYGTGAKPIITGFGSLSGWNSTGNWTNTSGNIWTFSTTNNIKRLWINGTEARWAADGTVDATDAFKWSANVLTVYSVGNPASSFTGVECCVYDYIFYCNYGNVSFVNLDLRGSHSGIRLYGNGDNTLIDNCDIGYNMDIRGVEAGASGVNSLDNVIISNCNFISNDTISYVGYEAQRTFAGIYLVYSASNWQIYNCTFSDWGHSCIDFIIASGYHVSNISIHDNYFTSPNTYYCRGLGVILNRGTATNIEIYNNYIFDCPVSSTVEGENILLHDNIFDGNHRENIIIARPYKTGSCLNIDYVGDVLLTNTKYYNNVFANAYDCGIDFGGYDGSNTYQGLEMSNNTFYNNGSSVRSEDYQLYIYDQPLMLGNTYKNNMFYKSGVTDLIRYGNSAINDYPHTISEFNAENGTDGDVISGNTTWSGDTTGVRFEYNATSSNKIVSLAGSYRTISGIIYINSISLPPFTSAVLFPYAGTGEGVNSVKSSGVLIKHNGVLIKY